MDCRCNERALESKKRQSQTKQQPEALVCDALLEQDIFAGVGNIINHVSIKFQNNRVEKIFVLSLKAAGTGLNLTAANHVIHYDLWWNPAVEA